MRVQGIQYNERDRLHNKNYMGFIFIKLVFLFELFEQLYYISNNIG